MSMGVNKVILVGNLGQDPETKTFDNGGKVCNLRIATSESWKDKQTGERKERTEWHNIAIFAEGLVDVATSYLRKGRRIYIEGQLRTRKWQDREGNDRYTTETIVDGFNGKLVMLDGHDGGGGERVDHGAGDNSSPFHNGGYGGQSSGAKPAAGAFDDDLDDDVPF